MIGEALRLCRSRVHDAGSLTIPKLRMFYDELSTEFSTMKVENAWLSQKEKGKRKSGETKDEVFLKRICFPFCPLPFYFYLRASGHSRLCQLFLDAGFIPLRHHLVSTAEDRARSRTVGLAD